MKRRKSIAWCAPSPGRPSDSRPPAHPPPSQKARVPGWAKHPGATWPFPFPYFACVILAPRSGPLGPSLEPTAPLGAPRPLERDMATSKARLGGCTPVGTDATGGALRPFSTSCSTSLASACSDTMHGRCGGESNPSPLAHQCASQRSSFLLLRLLQRCTSGAAPGATANCPSTQADTRWCVRIAARPCVNECAPRAVCVCVCVCACAHAHMLRKDRLQQ